MFDVLFLAAIFFFLFMVWFYLSLYVRYRAQLHVDPLLKHYPKISFIIPAYNEEKSIAGTIESIQALDWPSKPFDIIVVNDGSKDSTSEKVKPFLKKGVKLLDQKNQGKATALNNGIKLAQYDFIATVDADSFPEKDALYHMMGYFQDESISCVTCSVVPNAPHNFLERVQNFEYLLSNYARKIHSILDALYLAPGPLTIFRSKVLKEIKGFDPSTITEDLEIAVRLLSKHHRIANSMNAVTRTNLPKTLKAFIRQRLRWARGSIEITPRYRKLLFNPAYGHFGLMIFPALFFVSYFFISIVLSNQIIALISDFASSLSFLVALSRVGLSTISIQLHSPIYYLSANLILMVGMTGLGVVLIMNVLRLVGYRLRFKDVIPFIVFIMFWGPVLNLVWFGALFQFITKQEKKW